LDLEDMMNRYIQYGWTKQRICAKWGISSKSFGLTPRSSGSALKRSQFNAVTPLESQAVIQYAFRHTQLRHREMAFRMMDENVAFMSPSTVYRILSDSKLIALNMRQKKPGYWGPHKEPTSPDELWQADLTYLRYRFRDYYLLLFLDVFSRFITYWRLCVQMLGSTVADAFQDALEKTGLHPQLQTDNGSPFISHDFHTVIAKAGIDHRFIHPHCPNENAEIERVNRTIKEGIDIVDAESFEQLHEMIKNRIDFYYHVRYHSRIGFITPYTKYRGNPELIFSERQKKLEQAKENRIRFNLKNRVIITIPEEKQSRSVSEFSPLILANG
jgi:transposase InsO family protein